MDSITFGVLTVSDSCFAGTRSDTSGPGLVYTIKATFPEAEVKYIATVPDEKADIETILVDWASNKCDVILTTGGTGFAPRDVTPEATRAVIDREAPGLSYAMIQNSLAITPMAMLSRAVCGIRGKTMIANLPGNLRGSQECFSFMKPAIRHGVALLHGITDHNIHQEQIISQVRIDCAALRSRESQYPMIPVEEATSIVRNVTARTFAVELQHVNINDSLNRVLGENIYSVDQLPPFPASIKDGYAVIAADGPGIRTVRNSVAAGDEPSETPLQPGEVVRISTGAPVSPGADAVVQVEDTDLIEATPSGEQEISIRINVPPRVGQDIRPAGSDIPAEAQILRRGDVISPGHIGVLAAIGRTNIRVTRQLSVGIVSTGNELQSPYGQLLPGHIRDSNKLTLINLLKQYNYSSSDCGIARDDPHDVKRVLIAALSKHDVVITTGGVSMGEYDVMKQVLILDFNARIHFGRVNMKPGKPTTFASCEYKGQPKLIFALPGNPVSATVTTILFVMPALRYAEDFRVRDRRIKAFLEQPVLLDPRPEYMRAEIEVTDTGRVVAKTTGNQISSRLNSFVGAHVLLILPAKTEGRESLAENTEVDAIRIDPFIL